MTILFITSNNSSGTEDKSQKHGFFLIQDNLKPCYLSSIAIQYRHYYERVTLRLANNLVIQPWCACTQMT